MDFCDSLLYFPLRRLTQAGAIRSERAMAIVNAYVVAFLRANLNGEDATLLGAPSSPYPEVKIEQFVKKNG
jgi:hypothetical protein